MENLKSLQSLRLKNKGKPKLNMTVVLMLLVVILIISWKLFGLIRACKNLVSIEFLKNSTYSPFSSNGTIIYVLWLLGEICQLWFELCSSANAVFIAALCLNLHQEFTEMEEALGDLVKSREVYIPDVFAEWRNKFERIAHLVQNININISPVLFYDIFSLTYAMLAVIYNVLRECQMDWLIFVVFTLQMMFPFFILTFSTVAVNEKVRNPVLVLQKGENHSPHIFSFVATQSGQPEQLSSKTVHF